MSTYQNLMNLEQAAAFLGCTVADLLFVFHKAGMPSPLFRTDDLLDWIEQHAPVMPESEVRQVFRQLHAEGQDPLIVDNGHGGEAILVRVYEENDDEN